MTTTRAVLAPTVLALVLAGGLSACGSSGQTSSQSSTSPSATASTGGPSKSGSPTSKGSKGAPGMTVTASASAAPHIQIRPGLPKGYPQAQLPVVQGKVLGGSEGAFKPSGEQAHGWTVRVLAGGSVTSTLQQAESALKAKGFHQQGRTTVTKQYSQVTMQSSTYTLTMTAAKQKKGGTLVIYSFVAR